MDEIKSETTGGWEVYPDRVLIETPIMTVKVGPVLCTRSGRRKEFYRFDCPDWVNIVAVTPEREIVLIRQFRYGSNRIEIEIPGGTIEAAEDPVAAGRRELLEETGYAGDKARIIGRVCPNPAIQGNYCYTVLVEDAQLVAPPTMDEMEDIVTVPMAENEVRAWMREGKIEHGLVLNALMFYFSD
ncbi:MAG: NUDIX hydrolase [Desulfoprunum sp.]|uniref:NUDIX hydrolase n=1 Tax=Desulfoprunum sp. TaxID=2020866 RepID=UPI000691FD8E